MKKTTAITFLIRSFFCCSLMGMCSGKDAPASGLALTPPMGWNSWNAFGTAIDEQKIRETADALVRSGMRDAGYEYLVIDDGWMAAERNVRGELCEDPKKFPGGMKALGDYIHSKKLKFGIYECRGKFTCQKLPGSFEHEEQDMKTFASWGVDYVKLDACFAERNARASETDLEIYRNAIRKTGRPIIISISDFGNGSWAWKAERFAQLWRTSYDIRPNMESVLYCAGTSGGSEVIDSAFNGLWQFAGPGHWNDPDMLEVGHLNSLVQDRLHFSLWCMLAAPLMAGNDLRAMPDEVRKVLTAKELIALNQDSRGIQGYKIYDNGLQQVYNKPLSDGTTAVLLLNISEKSTDIVVRWKQIGLRGSQPVRDLWEQRDLGSFRDSFAARNLKQYEHVLLKVGKPGTKLLPVPPKVPPEKYCVTKEGTTWLTDLYYIMKQGDPPRMDKNEAGNQISIAGRKFQKGLGCSPDLRIMYKLNGKAVRLLATAGIDDEYGGAEQVRFKVYDGDYFGGHVLFESGRVGKGVTVPIDIDVSGVKELLLVTEGKKVPTDWADLRVVVK